MVENSELQKFIEGIPIGIYEVDSGGKFINVNQYLADLLGYSSIENLLGSDINDFYIDRKERQRLIDKMRNNGGKVIGEFLYWNDRGKRPIILSDSAQFVYDQQRREIGIRGILIDLWFIRLFDDVNTGFYRVASDQETIQNVNPVVARMFGYGNVAELEGKNISILYKDQNDLETLKSLLLEKGHVENYPMTMAKKDGAELVISVNASLIRDQSGKPIGREGAFTDITEQSKKLKILEDMPTGAYQAKDIKGKVVITYCNRAFAEMFGYDSPSEIIEIKEAKDFHASDQEYHEFEKKLGESDKAGKPMLEYRLHGITKKREKIWVEIDCHLLKDHKGNIIGRQGTTRDATDKVKYEQILSDKDKVQAFAHRFMAPMLSIKSTTDTFLEEILSVGNEFFPGNHSNILGQIPDKQFEQLGEIYNRTEILIKRIRDYIKENKNNKISQDLSARVNHLVTYSKDRYLEKLIELRVEHKAIQNYLRLNHTNSQISGTTPDSLEGINTELIILDKIWILFLAQSINNTQKIANVGIEGLRSFLLKWGEKKVDESYKFTEANIINLVQEVVDIYQLYAFERKLAISVNVEKSVVRPQIMISKDNITRMLHYLIENAVKYSFNKEGRYIEIAIRETTNLMVIAIENYGVGILPEEITQGKIFEFGYRGKFAEDRNRTGSGIGLAEAKKIAERHDGLIEVTSTPEGGSSTKITQNTPHKTVVKVTLNKNSK